MMRSRTSSGPFICSTETSISYNAEISFQYFWQFMELPLFCNNPYRYEIIILKKQMLLYFFLYIHIHYA